MSATSPCSARSSPRGCERSQASESTTTQRKPNELFEEAERAALLPLPVQRAELVVWRRATVHRDSHVVFAKALYSVPWRLIGRDVWVRACGGSVAIYAHEMRVAEHPRAKPGKRRTRTE